MAKHKIYVQHGYNIVCLYGDTAREAQRIYYSYGGMIAVLQKNGNVAIAGCAVDRIKLPHDKPSIAQIARISFMLHKLKLISAEVAQVDEDAHQKQHRAKLLASIERDAKKEGYRLVKMRSAKHVR